MKGKIETTLLKNCFEFAKGVVEARVLFTENGVHFHEMAMASAFYSVTIPNTSFLEYSCEEEEVFCDIDLSDATRALSGMGKEVEIFVDKASSSLKLVGCDGKRRITLREVAIERTEAINPDEKGMTPVPNVPKTSHFTLPLDSFMQEIKWICGPSARADTVTFTISEKELVVTKKNVGSSPSVGTIEDVLTAMPGENIGLEGYVTIRTEYIPSFLPPDPEELVTVETDPSEHGKKANGHPVTFTQTKKYGVQCIAIIAPYGDGE